MIQYREEAIEKERAKFLARAARKDSFHVTLEPGQEDVGHLCLQ